MVNSEIANKNFVIDHNAQNLGDYKVEHVNVRQD